MMTSIRLLTLDDVPTLTELVVRNRAHLAPWEPARGEHWFTMDGQLQATRDVLAAHASGVSLPCVIVDDDGRLVGRVGLSSIVRGALQSGSVSYWVTA